MEHLHSCGTQAAQPTRHVSGGVGLQLGLWPLASKEPKLRRTRAWTSNGHHFLLVCDLGRSFLTSWSLGSFVCKMGTMIPPHAGKMKGGHIRKAPDTGTEVQNVYNQLYARMFQIALLGKVRCPIRMWWLPRKPRFLCTKG